MGSNNGAITALVARLGGGRRWRGPRRRRASAWGLALPGNAGAQHCEHI